MNLTFLPATEPENLNYGNIPTEISGLPDATVRQVYYPNLVWYNESVRAEALKQLREWGDAPHVLVGFSKSGLGAWSIARENPELVSASIIFDSPVVRETLPPWGTAPFYADDAAWQADFPLNSIREYAESVSGSHRLILVSGEGFHEEMRMFSKALDEIGYKHVFLDRPEMKHHWNAGWVQEAADLLQETL